MLESINPATGQHIESFEESSDAQLLATIASVRGAFDAWSAVPVDRRAAPMRRAAALLRERATRLAAVMTAEMGKPVTQSEAEIEKCAKVCEYYADNAAAILAEECLPSDALRSSVRFDPLGVILAVMPWNFPFWQVFRFAAPALMAGNTGLLKHASNVTRCALCIEELLAEAGFPPHAFRALLLSSGRVEQVIRHPAVAAATLTGSEAAGAAVASAAGACLKKTVLELGGSDPFIVLADARLADAARTAAAARLLNTGQSCIAAKRFIVVDAVAGDFERLFVDAMRAHRVGDPMDRATAVGPLARPDLLSDLERQVGASLAAGARLLLGGRRIPGPGVYYEPTVLAGVLPGMPVFDEEVFGPVAAVTRARDADHALALANASPFGLGASIWTADLEGAAALAGRIDAGCVFVNGMVKSDPRLPFGGVKRSGYGRELSSFGMREFVNVKTVWMAE